MTLSKLRAQLSLLPQSTSCFTESVRYNLDALGRLSDAEMWSVLDKVGLSTRLRRSVSSDPKGASPNKGHSTQYHGEGNNESTHSGLDTIVSRSRWSQGELQLLCIARTLLNPCKVFFLDKPTSSLDPRLEWQLSRGKDLFGTERGVLVVAHRLESILEFDVIVVVIDGSVREIGSLEEVWEKKGWFWEVVRKGGLEGKVKEVLRKRSDERQKGLNKV